MASKKCTERDGAICVSEYAAEEMFPLADDDHSSGDETGSDDELEVVLLEEERHAIQPYSLFNQPVLSHLPPSLSSPIDHSRTDAAAKTKYNVKNDATRKDDGHNPTDNVVETPKRNDAGPGASLDKDGVKKVEAGIAADPKQVKPDGDEVQRRPVVADNTPVQPNVNQARRPDVKADRKGDSRDLGDKKDNVDSDYIPRPTVDDTDDKNDRGGEHHYLNRDRSLDRRDRDRERSQDRGDRKRDRSLDRKDRDRKRSQDRGDRNRDRSLDRKDRDRKRSQDRGDRNRDRSLARKDRDRKRSQDRGNRNRDRSLDRRERDRKSSQDRNYRHRNRSEDGHERNRSKDRRDRKDGSHGDRKEGARPKPRGYHMSRVNMPTGRSFYITKLNDPNWRCGDRARLVNLNPKGRTGKREFTIVSKQMQLTIDPDYFRDYDIIRIEKIVNGCLWDSYRKRQKEVFDEAGFVNERMLFHSSPRVWDIIDGGFDERDVAPKGKFGTGIYFLKDSFKANFFTFGPEGCLKHDDKECDKCERLMLLCRVALGKTKQYDAPTKLSDAPRGYQSVEGVPGRGGSKKLETIVYRGDQAYPEYLITYKIVY